MKKLNKAQQQLLNVYADEYDLFQHRVNHASNLKYSVEQIANLLDCTEKRVIRTLIAIGLNGLPPVLEEMDLLLYPCACGKGMMRKKDDVGCALCWDKQVG